jgi:competence protein ComEC
MMRNRKIIHILILLLVVCASILASIILNVKKPELKIIFLDVGQGDAILIEKGSNQILIDGGPSEQILLEKLGKYIPFWDREIETVIATHPDQDHIQGLLAVIKNYQVDNLIETSVKSESQLDKKFEELVQQKNIAKISGENGVTIRLDGAELDVISPDGETPDAVVKDTNSYSIVTRLVFGKNSFLFTGDLPDSEEHKLIGRSADLKSSVLKVSHHGSKYASSEDFLEKVQPEMAVISVGKNNRFGHPAPEALERLKKNRINILRTDEKGDIEFVCDAPQNDCLVAN